MLLVCNECTLRPLEQWRMSFAPKSLSRWRRNFTQYGQTFSYWQSHQDPRYSLVSRARHRFTIKVADGKNCADMSAGYILKPHSPQPTNDGLAMHQLRTTGQLGRPAQYVCWLAGLFRVSDLTDAFAGRLKLSDTIMGKSSSTDTCKADRWKFTAFCSRSVNLCP